MKTLPNWEAWSPIVLEAGEVLLWSSEDLKCCFYVYAFPAAWRPFMTFNKPIRSELLGLAPGKLVWLASAVGPMGWTSATGAVQHIHRRLLLAPPPAGAGVNRWNEIRSDVAFPCQQLQSKEKSAFLCSRDVAPDTWRTPPSSGSFADFMASLLRQRGCAGGVELG